MHAAPGEDGVRNRRLLCRSGSGPDRFTFIKKGADTFAEIAAAIDAGNKLAIIWGAWGKLAEHLAAGSNCQRRGRAQPVHLTRHLCLQLFFGHASGGKPKPVSRPTIQSV